MFTACESVVEDLNVNPNEFTEVPAQLVFNHAALNVAAIAEAEPARIAGMWSDQFAGTDRQYIVQDRFEVSAAIFDEIWADLYQGGISQAQIAQEQATAEGQTLIANYARLLEGYYAAEAALMFGDVPYTQANDPEVADPAYDSQMDVLNTAISLIQASTTGAGANNTVGSGNNIFSTSASWAQFGNALLARYYLAQGNYSSALSAAQAANFDEVSDDVNIIHTTTNFAENLFFQFEAEQRTDYLSFGVVGTEQSTLFSILSDTTSRSRGDDKTNDAARLAYFMTPDLTSELYRLNTTDGAFAAATNFPVIGYPEVQLIIAEAAARTGDEDTAIEALNNARNYWDTVTGADNYADLDGDDFDDNDSNDLLRTILIEKYASVFGLPTFYDIIRTDNFIGADMDERSTPAERFLYPSTEISSNSNFPGEATLDDPTDVFN